MIRSIINGPLYSIALIVLLALPVSSCARTAKTDSKYGPDALYFEALQKIQTDEYNDAVTLLKKSVKNSNPFVAKLSVASGLKMLLTPSVSSCTAKYGFTQYRNSFPSVPGMTIRIVSPRR